MEQQRMIITSVESPKRKTGDPFNCQCSGYVEINETYRYTITACLGLLHHDSNKASVISTETLSSILLFLQHSLGF